MSIAYALAPDLDTSALAAHFAEHGRVRIAGFLAPQCAEQLRLMLRNREDWKQVINSGEKLVELDRPTRASLSPEQAAQLDTAVYAGARQGFQYRYESLRVPDDEAARAASDDPLAAFASWMSQGPARDFLRTVTGGAQVSFADAQATAYAPGDFLTGHDDAFPGKNRHAAYVLGLNPVWRLEWGGLLLVHKGKDAFEGVVPAFNTLDLFSVGQMHSVSEVTRAAAYRRYSVTGWLRSGKP
ncbi:2OG-Fe(II) oxygenase [Novosphingobium sp. YJ-S2-02]|uniref:2OG-Fe(II) oxygenase n=1 Tax=Novosphingobium aureum TaxID=2792964 RepID=A0A931MKZ7_9SPHN|nr:2OG-Fe(II) oxygenase family protein [Novosphingobium aureum]MBH0112526.1 2OG-Fe(II) oxygenase [Novosphingobium aureum]